MKNFHLCSEDYEEVKRRLTMRQVAEFYGLRLQKNGTCLCPFHKDTHPSLKIYKDNKGFYCWSCGTGGDVIKFVSLLFGLKNQESCRKLIEDFGLPIQLEDLSYKERRERSRREAEYRKLQKFKAESYRILKDYWILLCEAANRFSSPHFDEALQELSIVEYRLECLKTCPEEYMADRKAVRRIGEIQRKITGWNDGA